MDVRYPLVMIGENQPPTVQEIMAAINNLNDRVTTIETRPADAAPISSGEVFTAADRAVLSEVAGFLGVHVVVATTLETKANNPDAVIDPTTGKPVQPVSAQRETFLQDGTGQAGV